MLSKSEIIEARTAFGKHIKSIRMISNMSEEDLAVKTGLKLQTIKSIEAGRFSMDFDIMAQISEALNCRLIMDRKDNF